MSNVHNHVHFGQTEVARAHLANTKLSGSHVLALEGGSPGTWHVPLSSPQNDWTLAPHVCARPHPTYPSAIFLDLPSRMKERIRDFFHV